MKILHGRKFACVQKTYRMAAAAFLALNAHAKCAAMRERNGSDGAMVAAHAAAKGDGLLEALLTELTVQGELKMDQVQALILRRYTA